MTLSRNLRVVAELRSKGRLAPALAEEGTGEPARAACRHKAAIDRVEAALIWLTSGEGRLEMLARNVIYRRFWERSTELQRAIWRRWCSTFSIVPAGGFMRSTAIGITITIALLTAASASAALPCETEYDDARHALFTAKIGQGSRQKVWAKVRNAWRHYESAKNQWEKNSQQQLKQAQQLLSSNATKHIPAATRTRLQGHVTALSQCLAGAPPIVLASLQVNAFLHDEEAGTKTPVGAGAIVSIDGIEEGTTNAAGTLTVQVPEGQHRVIVQQYGSRYGDAVAEAVAGVTTPVEVLLTRGAYAYRAADLYIVELEEGVLPETFTTLTAYILDHDAKPIAISRLSDVRLRTSAMMSESLLSSFAVQTDGRVAVTNLKPVKTWLDDHFGSYILELTVLDAASSPYSVRLGFEVGRNRATARLQAPASAPGVPLGGIPVALVHNNTQLVFTATTDASGAIVFPFLPDGFFQIYAETVHGGVLYLARGAVYVDADRALTTRLFAPGSGDGGGIQSVAGGVR